MDAPLSCGTSQGYGALDVPITISSRNLIAASSSFEDTYDPDFDSVLCHLELDYPNLALISVHDFYNESSNVPNALYDSSAVNSTPSAPSECKLQPRLYSRSSSLTCTYTPPPSSKVLELQNLPDQQPDDVSTTSHPIAAQDQAAPVIMLHPSLPSDDVVPGNIPSHFLHADAAYCAPNVLPHPHISMPPQQQPPAYPYFNNHLFDACPSVMCCQSHDPHPNFTFSISAVEAKHEDLHDASKLTIPTSMHHQYLQNSMKLGLPRLEIAMNPTACNIASSTTSPAIYMQSNTSRTMADSDSVGMEMSHASVPATSNSSLYWTSTPPEKTNRSVPPSPTPSVNKKESANEEIRSCPHGLSPVAFKVKTKLLNLHDGFQWKKYGEKIIKKEKYPRSYFNCNEKDRCKCKVVKRTQRCSNDEDSIVFTYLGRHNHPA